MFFKKVSHLIRHPHLLREIIYKKHHSTIIKIRLHNTQFTNDNRSVKKFSFKNIDNVDEIYDFYRRMNRSFFSHTLIHEWLSYGHECYGLYDTTSNNVMGALWVLRNSFRVKNFTFKTFTKNKYVHLKDGERYCCFVIIDKKYRGMGLGKTLMSNVLQYLYKNSVDIVYCITGTNNKAFISVLKNLNYIVIGRVQLINVMGILLRKEIEMKHNEITWSIVRGR